MAEPGDEEPARRAPRDSAFGAAADALNSLGSVLIIAIMVVVCADIASRGLFNQPLDGVSELVALCIVAVVFLQLASTLRHGRMARAEIFIDQFRLRNALLGGLLQALFDLAGVFVCAVIFWATLPRFEAAWFGNEFVGVHGQFTAPTWPVRLIVLIGSAFAAVQYMLHFLEDLHRAIARRAA